MSSFSTPSSSGQSNNTTASTAPASGGLFGSSTTPATSGSLFGSQSKTPPVFSLPNAGSGSTSAATTSGTPTTSLFGSSSAKPGEQKSFFGASSSGTPGSSTPSSSGGMIFGNLSQTPSSTDLFGNKPAATSTSTGPSIFGTTSSTPNTGAASTTPATAAPAGNTFGQQGTASNQANSASKPGGLFGTGAGAGFTIPSTSQATPAKPSLFLGSTTPAGAPLSNVSKPSSGLSLFGNSNSQNSSSLFSPVQQGEKKETQTTNVLGNQASPQPKPATTQPATVTPGALSMFPTASQSPKPGTPFAAAKPAEAQSALNAKPASTMSGSGGPSLFGQQAPSKPAETAPSTKPGLFGNATPSTTPSGSTPSLFKTPSIGQSAGASAPAPAATQTSSLFGNVNKPAAAPIAAEPQKSQPNSLFSSLSKPAASTATSDAPKSTSLFGTTTTSTTAAPTTTTTAPSTLAASTATTAPSTSSLFNAAKATPSAESTAPKPAASQSASLGASTSGPTSSMARLKNKTMDEIMSRWATDLSKYQKEFKEQAAQVAAWDRLLVENGEKIQKLYLNTFEAEKASREVERHLVTVESQQEELESWLDKYELEVDALFSKQIGPGEQLAGPDQERERTYKLAEKITERLDEMSRDLTKMIKEINEISGTVNKSSKPDDPLSQIVRVLNGHLTQLQWIDTNAAALQAKIAAAQKASSQISSQYGGPEQDNADSFYRSYMGRR